MAGWATRSWPIAKSCCLQRFHKRERPGNILQRLPFSVVIVYLSKPRTRILWLGLERYTMTTLNGSRWRMLPGRSRLWKRWRQHDFAIGHDRVAHPAMAYNLHYHQRGLSSRV